MRFRRPKAGGRYIAWMRGAFRGTQARLGAPEVAGGPYSQPKTRGRNTARTGANGCQQTPREALPA
jgi:hypothetical protein